MKGWALAAWGGFIAVGGAGLLGATLDANGGAFLLGCGAGLAGVAFIVRAIDFGQGRDVQSPWRYVLASALGGGLLVAGASVLGLFDPPRDAAPLIAWIYVATGALVIGALAIKLRTRS